MSIFKLKRRAEWKDIPWDTTILMIVRAPNEKKAREEASNREPGEDKGDWLDDTIVSCEQVKATGKTEVIASEGKIG